MPQQAVRRPTPGLPTDRYQVRAREPRLRRTIRRVLHVSLSAHGRRRHSGEARLCRPISAARIAGVRLRRRKYCLVGNRCSRSKSRRCGVLVENHRSLALALAEVALAVALAAVARECYMLASSSYPDEAAESPSLSWSWSWSRSRAPTRS